MPPLLYGPFLHLTISRVDALSPLQLRFVLSDEEQFGPGGGDLFDNDGFWQSIMEMLSDDKEEDVISLLQFWNRYDTLDLDFSAPSPSLMPRITVQCSKRALQMLPETQHPIKTLRSARFTKLASVPGSRLQSAASHCKRSIRMLRIKTQLAALISVQLHNVF